jgi:threonine synthase
VSSFVSHLSCPRCGRSHDHRVPQNVCSCGSPLLVEYDLEAVASAGDLRQSVRHRPPTMWRYHELLPADDPSAAVTLGEGMTPLLPTPDLGRSTGLPDLWVKDEGQNPTGTFKCRGASAGVTRALELGIAEVALPTAGNAGGAWAAYGAAAGVGVHVAMPADAPAVNRLECILHGADLSLVEGLISDAGRVIAAGILAHGWFDVSTLREPYRIEGKKTLGLEIAEQLGWTMPDAIVYPAGGGVGIIGIWRALLQLRELGWVEGGIPRLCIVQAEGCAPLVRAFEAGSEVSEPWKDARTLAHGLRVPKAVGDFLVLRAVRETGGSAVAVSDEDLLCAMRDLGREGISACPEGAATLVGARVLRERGDLGERDRVVLINTGTALKYGDALEALSRMVAAGDGTAREERRG